MTSAAAVRAPAVARTRSEPPPWMDEAPPIEQAEQGVREPPPPPFAAPRAEVAAATVVVERTPLGDRWADAVAQLNQRQAVTALVRELAMQAEVIDWTGGAAPLLRLRVERESLRNAPLRDKLQAALAELLDLAALRLEVEAGVAADSPARREVAEKARRQQEAEQIIHNDPLVQEMLAQFATARIVPGSIKPH